MKKNNGELAKCYVHGCHPAIIDRETFQKVQEEIARRASLRKVSAQAKTQLIAKKAELVREGRSAAEFDRHMEQIGTVIDRFNANVTVFDDVTIRQLISCIKVLDKTHILVRFKDGTEIEQEVIRE